jgi:hypothetical protein
MSQQQGYSAQPGEVYCRETQTLVEDNKMRPGYDCRCSGYTQWVARNSDPMRREK